MAEYLDIVDENGIPTAKRRTQRAFGTAPALDAKALASLLASKPSTATKNRKAENL